MQRVVLIMVIGVPVTLSNLVHIDQNRLLPLERNAHFFKISVYGSETHLREVPIYVKSSIVSS